MRGEAPSWLRVGKVASRVLAAVGAGYACTAAVVALTTLLLSLAFGMARGEAVVLAAMAGFLLYLTVLLWGFAEPRLARVWAVLVGAAVLCWGLAQWLAPLAAARVVAAG